MFHLLKLNKSWKLIENEHLNYLKNRPYAFPWDNGEQVAHFTAMIRPICNLELDMFITQASNNSAIRTVNLLKIHKQVSRSWNPRWSTCYETLGDLIIL